MAFQSNLFDVPTKSINKLIKHLSVVDRLYMMCRTVDDLPSYTVSALIYAQVNQNVQGRKHGLDLVLRRRRAS